MNMPTYLPTPRPLGFDSIYEGGEYRGWGELGPHHAPAPPTTPWNPPATSPPQAHGVEADRAIEDSVSSIIILITTSPSSLFPWACAEPLNTLQN